MIQISKQPNVMYGPNTTNPTHIPSELSALDATISDLEEVINKLRIQLSPVMNTATPKNDPDIVDEAISMCEVACAIRRAWQKVNDIIRTVNDIINALEV